MIRRSIWHHFLQVAVTRRGTPQGKTRLRLLSSPFCLSLLLSGNYAWFFPGRMHTQVHGKTPVSQHWLSRCLPLWRQPARQRLYLNFFSVSPGIMGSGLLRHLRSGLAPLSIHVPTQPPQWVMALLPVFVVPPTPFLIVLCVLTGSAVKGFRNVIQGHRLQRECVDIRSPLVQTQVKLKAGFARYCVEGPIIFSLFLDEQGTLLFLKLRSANSHNVRWFFWGGVSSSIGFAKDYDSGSHSVAFRQAGLWPHIIMKLQMRSAIEAEHDIVRGAVLLRSQRKSGPLAEKNPSITISQCCNTALQRGNYME